VFPITDTAAYHFQKRNPVKVDVKVPVGISGTGGGFRKFCAGTTDISDASRPINKEEVALCASNGVEYIEIPVAYDGLAVVVNPKNSTSPKPLSGRRVRAGWTSTRARTTTNSPVV
ncbi:MAG TPA: substrate-binding domain-containing protein, partial [Polyangiaceae bacterium]